ncbi:hypothetical protein WDW37_07605 [Bdellovibrionota bacterium FG-1]
MLIAFTISLASLSVSAASPNSPVLEFDRTEENLVYFKTPNGTSPPRPLKTELFDLKYLGALKTPANTLPSSAYFLFSGRPCKNCLQDAAIYALKPSGGPLTTFVHPGKIFESKTRSLVLESRAFFGKCLSNSLLPVYVIFQKERIDKLKGMQASVLIAEPGADHLSERLLERHLPRLQDTLRLVKQKTCREIEGRNRIMLSKPLDLNLRRKAEETNDEEVE